MWEYTLYYMPKGFKGRRQRLDFMGSENWEVVSTWMEKDGHPDNDSYDTLVVLYKRLRGIDGPTA
jgi:hypothetical protein